MSRGTERERERNQGGELSTGPEIGERNGNGEPVPEPFANRSGTKSGTAHTVVVVVASGPKTATIHASVHAPQLLRQTTRHISPLIDISSNNRMVVSRHLACPLDAATRAGQRWPTLHAPPMRFDKSLLERLRLRDAPTHAHAVAVEGVGWQRLRPLVCSATRSAHRQREGRYQLVVLVRDDTETTAEAMRNHFAATSGGGEDVASTRALRILRVAAGQQHASTWPIQWARYRLYAHLLEANPSLQALLISDATDVVVQRDPLVAPGSHRQTHRLTDGVWNQRPSTASRHTAQALLCVQCSAVCTCLTDTARMLRCLWGLQVC